VTTWLWSTNARVIGPTEFEMQYDQVQPVQFQMAANRGRPTTALILGGQVVVEK
jgi:hypothetical protein